MAPLTLIPDSKVLFPSKQVSNSKSRIIIADVGFLSDGLGLPGTLHVYSFYHTMRMKLGIYL
ncbi:hypothetical protein M378DRAFT_168381 [Amanita muscaria Koide BX008]|uniref:Uncharacterized protein n=1 Tax=Amanita muscaria (strain Koide BX008) TaxID=946122 RepID=A0A0C2SBK9_AMAMK|nr:hypothetical protein M378DRAFT_168381 [Amanita muscaria Koide BX008]